MSTFWNAVAQDLGDYFGIGSQRRQQEFNSAEALEQRRWQEQLANTAHQREVADLQKAGLNPVLSASLGGSVTPSASSASTSGAVNSAGNLNSMIGTYSNFKLMQTQMKMLHDEKKDLMEAQTRLYNTQARLNNLREQYGNLNSAHGLKNLVIKLAK